jgi:hypothetical protein
MKKQWKFIDKNLNLLNNSKIFAALIMICLNIGSKYITVKLSKSQEEYMKNYVAREVLVFAVIWMGTKDVVLSLVLTFVFYVVTQYLFHEESALCLMPSYLKKIQNSIDTNSDGNISQEEIDKAVKVLAKAKEDQQQQQKTEVYKYFSNNKY